MSILLFSRVAYEQSFDTCYKDYDNLYQIWSVFTVKGEKYPPQEQNCGPVAGAILENFPEQVEAATSTCHWMNAPLYNENARFDERKIVADSLFFKTMGIEVLSGNPVKDLQQPNVIFLSDRFAGRIFGGENPVGKTVNYNHEKDFTVKGTYEALPEMQPSILKPLSLCPPCGTTESATTHGAGETVIPNTSVSVPVRTSRW